MSQGTSNEAIRASDDGRRAVERHRECAARGSVPGEQPNCVSLAPPVSIRMLIVISRVPAPARIERVRFRDDWTTFENGSKTQFHCVRIAAGCARVTSAGTSVADLLWVNALLPRTDEPQSTAGEPGNGTTSARGGAGDLCQVSKRTSSRSPALGLFACQL